MRRTLAGPGTNIHNVKKDTGKIAPAAVNTGGFRAAGTAVGPASSQTAYVATQDIGKQAPAAGADGFRMTGTAVGPSSSQTAYVATQDIGKQAPAAGTDGFRMTGTAVGPSSSQTSYVATQDIDKQMPAAGEAYWAGGEHHGEHHPQ